MTPAGTGQSGPPSSQLQQTKAELETALFEGLMTTEATHYRSAYRRYRLGAAKGAIGEMPRNVQGDDEASVMTSRGTTSISKLHRPPDRPLRVGDTLLLEAPDSWVQASRTTHHFAYVRRVGSLLGSPGGDAASEANSGESAVETKLKLAASVVALLILLVLSALEVVSLFPLALSIGYALVAIGCITLDQAWRSISYRLVLTIAASFGPGAALTSTNLSAVIGAALVELQVLGPFGFLLAIYLITAALSCIVSNSATVVAFYSVLRDVSIPGVKAEQLMIVMMLGASSAFATPIGYQTNLMVLGRGGYAFADFLALGGGLIIVVGCCVAGLALAML
uniref:Citrate transporter-like domain-containing protein n=1 Tax=Haptolina brevifila TaxID=156173 RepID=A0A7S2NPS7_9EUKA